MFQGFVQEFLSPERADAEATLIDIENKKKTWRKDTQVPEGRAWYGLHWQLLEEMTEAMEDITGLNLAPTYCYSRLYPHGAILHRHSDRPSCEVSVTVNLRNQGGVWPFGYELGGEEILVNMYPGDAVVYAGCDTEHWRDANPAQATWQAFLHYVNLDGPHAEHANEYMLVKKG